MKSLFELYTKRFSIFQTNPGIKYSIAGILIVIMISTILLSFNILGTTYEYRIGDIATEEIKVKRDIHYVNEEETSNIRKISSESVPALFDRDAGVLQEKIRWIEQLFGVISSVMEENPIVKADDFTFHIMEIKPKLPSNLQFSDRVFQDILRYKNIEELKKIILRILIYVYNEDQTGILERQYDNPLKLKSENVIIRNVGGNELSEVSRKISDLKTLPEVRERIYNISYSLAPNLPKNTLETVVFLVNKNLRPSLKFNLEETKRRIDEKMKLVPPVMGVLKKGQIIVRDGDSVTQETISRIKIYNSHNEKSHYSFIAGVFIAQVVFLLIFGFFMLEFPAVLIPEKKSSFLIISVVVFFMIYAFLITRVDYISNSKYLMPLLLPIPFVTMIVSILYNSYLAIIVGIHVVFFSAILGGGDISVVIISFSSAVLGVFVNGSVNKRSDFLKGGFIIGLLNTVVVIAVGMIDETPTSNITKTIYVPFASGIINSILVLGIIPFYEYAFGITTKFRLLELSDLNADIFKNMLVNAPGTYNHSLLVSTMAEAACKDISANALLARVGAFYHDIGKVEDSGIYIENKLKDPRSANMTPSEYSKLIISHVSKGEKIARENRIPESVIDFIREHHGLSVMTYFYHQALEEAQASGTEYRKSDFQYPGPRPRSRESAIVMLADSVEAASRSVQDPTYSKLEGLVKKIFYNKLNDGELEDSDLTMSDLNKIQKAFLTILNGIFHTRIEYPEKKDLERLEEKLKENGNGEKK